MTETDGVDLTNTYV